MAETQFSSVQNYTMTEYLAPALGLENLPNIVLTQFAHMDSLNGIPSNKLRINKDTKIARAVAGPGETVDISTSVEMTLDTPIDVTPTEYVQYIEQTDKATRKIFPGTPNEALAAVRAGNMSVQTLVSLYGRAARKLVFAHIETIEYNLGGLLSGFTDAVGTSGAAASFTNCLQAIHLMEVNENPTDRLVWALAPEQVHDLRTELIATGSGNFNFAQFSQLNTFLGAQISLNGQVGFKGTLLGIPVYMVSQNVRRTANSNADVVGALIVPGQGSIVDSLDTGTYGAIGVVEDQPPTIEGVRSALGRKTGLVATSEHAVYEAGDNRGVSITTRRTTI